MAVMKWISGRPICVEETTISRWYFGRPFTYEIPSAAVSYIPKVIVIFTFLLAIVLL